MQEIPLLFGPEAAPLMGTVTAPAEGAARLPVACLMLNMGAGYRVGPRRMNVKLARHLAQHGIASLRLDLAGQGDSSAPTGGEGFTQQAVRDLQAAMQQLEAMFGIRRFVVLGLCSGGAHGLSVAAADPRVVGLLMFDTYAFPTRRTLLARNMYRALAMPRNPAIWAKTWRLVKVKLGLTGVTQTPIFDDESPAQTLQFFRRAMAQLAERDVALLLLYSGSMHVRDHGRDQMGALAAEPFMQRLEYRFMPEVDHTLASVQGQALFLDVVAEWVLRTARKPAAALQPPDALRPADRGPATNDSVFVPPLHTAPCTGF